MIVLPDVELSLFLYRKAIGEVSSFGFRVSSLEFRVSGFGWRRLTVFVLLSFVFCLLSFVKSQRSGDS